MQKLRVLGLYAVILAVAVYAVIKAYIYFSIKGMVDETIVRASPFVQISYRGISSDIRGEISVDGIEVNTPNQTLPLRVGSLRLEGPGIGFLFDAAAGFKDDRIPRWMYITLNRAELPDVEDLVPPVLPVRLGVLHAELEPCGLGGLLRHTAPLRSESYPLILTLQLGYRFNSLANSGEVELGYDTPDGESMRVELALTDIPEPGALMFGAVPGLDQLSFSYVPVADRLKRELGSCARESDLTDAMYAEKLLTQPADHLVKELGFVPGNGLRQALKRFLLEPGEIKVGTGPIADVLKTASGQIPPQQLVKLLDFELSVNGEAVDDLSFESAPQAVSAGGAEPRDDTPGAQPRAKVRAHLIETPPAELKNYLGRDVRVFISGHESAQRGVLISVRDEEADVEKRLLGGKMTLHVPFEDIVRIEVMRFRDTAQ